jgi:uncharacterized protein
MKWATLVCPFCFLQITFIIYLTVPMQHTNQLINASSPYLLQHAHNPVNWFFWGEEALQKAKNENKPILISIGYSSCHWCHVMEKESFEDEATAALMNDHFINVKIDREERPDLDHIYMDAVQAMTGSGGWPLNVFLTPELKPFYGGTYFPPKNAHGRISWKETLLLISKAFKDRKDEIEEQAEKLTLYLKNSSSLGKLQTTHSNQINLETLNIIAENLMSKTDKVWGGFGAAPKFPQSYSILYLLRHYHFTKDETCLQQAVLSLDKMIFGGIYDHIGGGFARYSTDERWFAPHFEKMLYDNALLISTLAEAYQITKKELYAETIHQSLDFITREMMSSEFAFYSALDADSEGVEGKFYTWSNEEIATILKEDAKLFTEIFNITEHGNWEETNIVYLKKSITEIAADKEIDEQELNSFLNHCKRKLLHEREKRIKPLLDDKTLCSWNALMNIAFSKAFIATGNDEYRIIAEKNMNFLLSNMFNNDVLHHCYKNEIAYNDAFLEDYAYLILALIQLQEITGNLDYLLKAKKLTNVIIDKFSDTDSNYFFFTPENKKNILVRKVDLYDGATPSANAIFAHCLQYLSVIFFNDDYKNLADKMLFGLQTAVEKYPTSFSVWALAYQQVVHLNKEIVITGVHSKNEIKKIHEVYIPNKILLISDSVNSNTIPILKDKKITSTNQYYLCQNQTCFPPTDNLQKFLHLYNT